MIEVRPGNSGRYLTDFVRRNQGVLLAPDHDRWHRDGREDRRPVLTVLHALDGRDQGFIAGALHHRSQPCLGATRWFPAEQVSHHLIGKS